MKSILIVFTLFVGQLFGQNIDFNISVSNDTLLLGNYLEVKFEINNGNGKFIEPNFAGWNVISGPNSASSYSFVNGEVSQSSSFTYYLEAPVEGDFIIGEAKLKTEDNEYKTPLVKIVVLENPNGIRQHPNFKSDEKYLNPDIKLPEQIQKKRKVSRL